MPLHLGESSAPCKQLGPRRNSRAEPDCADGPPGVAWGRVGESTEKGQESHHLNSVHVAGGLCSPNNSALWAWPWPLVWQGDRTLCLGLVSIDSGSVETGPGTRTALDQPRGVVRVSSNEECGGGATGTRGSTVSLDDRELQSRPELSKLWTCLQGKSNVPMRISGNKGFVAEETKVRLRAEL